MTVQRKPFVFYAGGQPVRVGDIVRYRGGMYEVLALWIDRDDKTNVSLFSRGRTDKLRANSVHLTFVRSRSVR